MGIVKERGYAMGGCNIGEMGWFSVGRKPKGTFKKVAGGGSRIRPIEAIYFLETACVPYAALFCPTLIDAPQSVTCSSQSPVRTDNHCQVTAIITNHNRHVALVLINLILLINLLHLINKSNHVTSKTKF